MSESPDRPKADAEAPAEDASDADLIESRENRREERGKNTLILRELAIIAALLLAILAFNLNWSESSNRDMSAREHDEIQLRNVQVTEQPEPKEPEPQQPEPQPKQQVPKETPRREVPDETVQEVPEMTSEPEATPETESMEKIQSSTLSQTSEPAPESKPKPKPKPPKNEIFSQGTVDQNPQMQESLSPEYPQRARQAGIEGRVIVQFVVDESGRAQDITVLRSPNEMLSEAAVQAVREARFSPGQQNGQPVKVRMSQPVTFRLQQ